MREINERLVDKIRKLIAHEQSAREIGNIAEAAAFAERIQQLLIAHKLSITEIEANDSAEPDAVTEEIFWTTPERFPLRKRIDPNFELLFNVVVKNHFCECISQKGYNMIFLIGREADRAVAIEMYLYLLATMRRLCSAERKALKRARRSVRNFRSSFYRGFIGAIASRYEAMRRTHGESTALVLRRSEEEARAKVAELHPNQIKRPFSKRDRVNRAALMAGVTRGHEVSLTASVIKDGKPAPKFLTGES